MRLLAIAALLLAGACAHAHAHPNLYACLKAVNASTLTIVDALPNLKKLALDPKTRVTLLAPDNQAIKGFVVDFGLGMTLAQLVKEPALASLIETTVLHHIIQRPYTTSAWPTTGKKTVFTKGGGTLKLYRDADGDPQVAGADNDAELNCRNRNMVCGASIMQSIDEVLLPEI